MSVNDLKLVLFFAAFAGSVFFAGFWMMKNIARIIDDRTSGLVGRFDSFDLRLEQLEEKSEESRNLLYRHIEEKWSELFILISSLDQKYISKETFTLHHQSQTALKHNAASLLNIVDTGSTRIAEALESLALAGKGRHTTPSFLSEDV